MTDIELTEMTFVYHNGIVNTYRVGDRWGFVAVSGDCTIHADATYVNKYCARSNAWQQMKDEFGIEFKKRG